MTKAFEVRVNCYIPTMDNTEALHYAKESILYWHKKEHNISRKGHEQSLEFVRTKICTQTKAIKTGLSISIYPGTMIEESPND